MNQDYNNIEIIIIDDCSGDNTENIINNLIKENSNIIRSYKFTKKVGAGQARQKGIYMSNGKYISFLDDDDEWLPNKLTLQLEALENNNDIGAVTSWYILNNNGIDIKVSRLDNLKANDILWANILGSFSFCLIRSSMIKNSITMNTKLPSCQDWDFWIKILKICSVGVMPEYLVRYNVHSQDRITNSQEKKATGIEYLLKNYANLMSEEQKTFLCARINECKAMSLKNASFIKRLAYKNKSLTLFKEIGHIDYNSIYKIAANYINTFLPRFSRLLRSLYHKIYPKHKSDVIVDNEKILFIAKKMRSNNNSFGNNIIRTLNN